MTRIAPLPFAALLLTTLGAGALAQETAAPTPDDPAAACTRFSAVEIDGKAEVDRRIAEIDAAAGRGDVEGLCASSEALVAVYRAMQEEAGSCSARQAARWADAAAQTEKAVSGTCR